ncbi:MAG: hypothetical protein GXP38_04990 [Chloroflexi bacterium]|nr:hypothetical protein [Chloroflexota bacterium]
MKSPQLALGAIRKSAQPSIHDGGDLKQDAYYEEAVNVNKDTVNKTSSQAGRGKGVAIAMFRANIWARELPSNLFKVPARDFAVLCALISRIDGKYYCYPTQQEIAADAKLLPRRLAKVDRKEVAHDDATAINTATTLVGRATKVLEKAGLIRIKRTPTRHKGTLSEYWLRPDSGVGSKNQGPDSDVTGDLTLGSFGPDSGVGSSYKDKQVKSNNKDCDAVADHISTATPSKTSTPEQQGTSDNGEPGGCVFGEDFDTSTLKPSEMTPEILANEFRALFEIAAGEQFTLTGKAKGQFAEYLKRTGHYALPAMDEVFLTWGAFVDYVREQVNSHPDMYKSCAQSPDIGVMVKHADQVVNYHVRRKAMSALGQWDISAVDEGDLIEKMKEIRDEDLKSLSMMEGKPA